MRIDLPDGLETFANEFSLFKTPARRTQGWEDDSGKRGKNDILDTIGTLMLWRYLVEQGHRVTYFLTANSGDETDLRVEARNQLNINVKTSLWQPRDRDIIPAMGFIGVKEIELKEQLPDIYAQVIVHLTPPESQGWAHVHLCNWISTKSDSFLDHAKSPVIIPNSKGTKGLWISSRDATPLTQLPAWLRRVDRNKVS